MAAINVKSSTFPAIDEKYCPEAGMDLLGGAGGGGVLTPLALARGGGVLFFIIKQKGQNEIQ